MEHTEGTAAAWLLENNFRHFRTGSREICNPPVMNTDVDFVVLGRENFDWSDWTETTGDNDSYGTSLTFRTFRSGEVNLIVVYSAVDFVKWRAATLAAKGMNLTNKQKRIALFQGILYGNWGE